MRNGWRGMDDAGRGKDADRQVLVWHIFQGVLILPYSHRRESRFDLYWQDMPDRWRRTEDTPPRGRDADAFNCVIARNVDGHARMLGWHQVEPKEWPMWQKAPGGPEE